MEHNILDEVRNLCRQLDELDTIIQQELPDSLQQSEYKAARENKLKQLLFLINDEHRKL